MPARYGVREEIRESVESFYRALSTKNLKLIESIWANEPYAAVAGVTGRNYVGWSEVCQFWERRFRELGDTTVRAKLIGMNIHAVGDVAWLSGSELRTIVEGDGMRQEQLRVTCVFERKGSGWQIVLYHASVPVEEESPLLALIP